ncbi:MAG: NTP transferase domain-containing protein [Calditrichaeota bacterium]|nr:NTP transferase domain-containing protein [Calditrichota bacterium]
MPRATGRLGKPERTASLLLPTVQTEFSCLLGDQPNLTPETLNRFVEIFWEGKKKIVAARYGGVIGNPVLFHRAFFPDLQRLQGDTSARSLLQRFSENIAAIDIAADEASTWIPQLILKGCNKFVLQTVKNYLTFFSYFFNVFTLLLPNFNSSIGSNYRSFL